MTLIPIHNTGDPITTPDGLPAAGCIIDCLLVDAITRRPCSAWDAVSGELVTTATATVTCDDNGEIPIDAETDVSTLTLWPNDRGNVATMYRITARNGEFVPFMASLASNPAIQTFIEFMAGGEPLTPAELSALSLHVASPMHLPLPVGANGSFVKVVDGVPAYVAVAPGMGDMTADVYDSNADGIVNAADAVPWTGITDKPATYPPETHTHNYAAPLGADDNYVTGTEKSALHGHSNKTTLDKVGETANLPTWNGSAWPGVSGTGGGTLGSVWHSGTGAPDGSLGVVTDWYLDDASGDVYEKTGAASWALRDNLTGPPGAAGAAGAAGPNLVSTATTTDITGILKGNGTTVEQAQAGTDYVAPDGNISGTSANLSGTPALPNGTTVTTQAWGDASTKPASTAFLQLVAEGKENHHGWNESPPVSSELSIAQPATNWIFSLTPATGTFEYYLSGRECLITGIKTIDLGATPAQGHRWVYIDTIDGTLKTASSVNLATQVPICTLFYNGTSWRIIEERHSKDNCGSAFHLWAHLTIGLQYLSGLTMTAPAVGTNTTVAVGGGTLFDEDIRKDTTAQTAMVIWSQTGATTWTFETPATTPYPAVGIRYAKSDSAYAMTSVASNRYINMWYYGNLDTTLPIQGFVETALTTYSSVANARAVIPPSLVTFEGNADMKLLYRVIWRGDGVVQEVTDYRSSSPVAGGGVGAVTAAAVSYTPTTPFTNVTVQGALDQAATLKANLACVRHVFWPAGAAIPSTTNPAAVGTVESATNKVMYDTYDFDSAVQYESVQFVGNLEHYGAGTIKCKAVWTYAGSPSGTSVQWKFSARSYADNEALDQATGTAQVISDAKQTALYVHITGTTPAITVAGTPANGQPIILKVARDVDNDDLGADARLLGIWIEYTEASTEESEWT